MQAGIKMFLVVLVVVLFALLIFPLIVTNTITAAVTTGIGSFVGTAALLGLVPLGVVVLIVWYIYKRVSSGKD